MLRLCGLTLACALAGAAPAQPGPAEVFNEACSLVEEHFYDPDLHGVDWRAVRDELLPLAERADSAAALSAVINSALDRLGASHTRHYHPGEAAYYELLDVFNPDGLDEGANPLPPAGPVTYTGIGVATREIGGRVFIEDVYHTGPADAAGLLAGDEIVAVEGDPWRDAASFAGRRGVPTAMSIRREGPDAEAQELVVTPERISPRELFAASLRRGARIVRHGDAAIGVIRVRSYAHPDYHEAVMELATGRLAAADALVLDIRGGWGGANPSYMSLVNPVVPELEMKRRGRAWVGVDAAWRKPLVVIIDGGSRSGKEVLAHAYKSRHLATLVGERTAGAVLGGRLFTLGDGGLLYLAVADVRVDGERLEGVGVEPDVVVERELPYSQGRDRQLEAALDEAARRARGR